MDARMPGRFAAVVIALLALPSVSAAKRVSGGETKPQWAMFHNDSAHTGLSRFSAASNTGSLEWTYSLSSYVQGSPTIGADGTVYITGASLYAIAPNGTTQWTFPITGAPLDDYSTDTPAIDTNGMIYFGAYTGDFYAVDSTGAQQWALPMNARVFDANATVSSGTIYVGSDLLTGGGKLNALNPDSSTKWSFGLNTDVYAVPSIRGASLVIATNGSSLPNAIPGLYLLGTATGSLVSEFQSAGAAAFAFACPIGPDGSVYAIHLDGTLGKFAFPSGRLQWVVPIAPHQSGPYLDFWSSPAIGPDGTVYVNSVDGNLYSISPSGAVNWTVATGGSRSSPAIGADGTIFVGSVNNNLYAINWDGSVKWTFTADSSIDSSPAIAANGAVYFASDGGTLYALH